jgi:type III secretory pathway component EscV
MPAYGTQEFFVWCRKTKKAREEKKAREVAAKEAAKAEKEAAKAAKEAAKAAKKAPVVVAVENPKVKVKPRIKVKEATA